MDPSLTSPPLSALWPGCQIGEGATIGAVFTLFYGPIRAFTTKDEQVRFVAVATGLVIALALVYRKFSRSPAPGETS